MNVVLVEDDETCREVVEATLTRQGATVRSVSTGPYAVELLDDAFRVDLLITDLQLPGDFDGWSVAHLFRDEYPEIPVIYITGSHGSSDHVSNSILLRKPFSPDLLVQAVKAIL